MARLEERTHLSRQHDREANYQAWLGLHHRMDHLTYEMRTRASGQPLGAAGWGKIVLSLLLFLLAYLLTGSLPQALRVASGVPGL